MAQSANSFASPADKPVASEQPQAAPSGGQKPAAANIAAMASRHVGTDLDAYLQAVTAVFAMASRETDPFGQFQDPDAKPAMTQTLSKTPHRSTPVQAVPLSEIIRQIKVTTVMPGEKRFLVRTRSIAQGDRISINFRGRIIPLKVTGVNSREIAFANSESGETAVLEINLMPVGMTPGGRGITAPGMETADPNAPLELESATSLPQVP